MHRQALSGGQGRSVGINDPTTAEFLSKTFGEREVIKKFSSSQMSPTDLGDRISISDQERLEKVILPTEFQNLPDFYTYLKIANHGITRMETPRNCLQLITPEFIPSRFEFSQVLSDSIQIDAKASEPAV